MTDISSYAGLLRYRDRIKQELRILSKQQGTEVKFYLNPGSLKPIAPAIGTAPATATMNESQKAVWRADVTALQESIAVKARPAQARMEAPPTASAEIGWYAAAWQSRISKPFALEVHSKSDVAKYGEDYGRCMQAGPFDKTQPVARN
jgi:hypothetical protein